MRRYKYIGRDGSSGYRTGKKYWGKLPFITTNWKGEPQKVIFRPLNSKRQIIIYTDYNRFKADWE